MNITVNNKEWPMQFGMGAIEIYCGYMGIEHLGAAYLPFGLNILGEFDPTITDLQRQKAMKYLLLASIENYCNINDTQFAVTYAQLTAAIDEMEQDSVNSMIEYIRKYKMSGRTLLGEAEVTLKDDVDKKKETEELV